MKLKFKSIINLITKFTPLALFAALGLALAAPQTAQAGNYYKFVILGVKENQTGNPFGVLQYGISELALYSDAAGTSRLNGSGTITVAKSVESGLGEGECFATSGSPLDAFDGSTSTKWWGNAGDFVSACPYIVMRLADTAAPAASYNLATTDAPYRNVTKWALYKSSDGVTWGSPIAEKSLADSELPSTRAWYNGGTAFTIGTQPPSSDECWVRFTITKLYPETDDKYSTQITLSRFAVYNGSTCINLGLQKGASASGLAAGQYWHTDNASNLFIENNNKWTHDGTDLPQVITMRLTDGAVPEQYNLRVSDVQTSDGGKFYSLLGRYPTSWTVETSSDGETWNLVSTVTDDAPEKTQYSWYKGGGTGSTPTKFYPLSSTPSKKSIAYATVTYVPTSYPYNGEKQEPEVTVTLDNVNITTECDITWGVNDCINVGSYTPTIEAKSTSTTYEGTVLNPGSFEITAPVKKSIANATVTYDPTSATYDGSQQKPDVTVTLGGVDITGQCDFTWTPNENFTDAATYTPTITAKDGTDYEGTVTEPGSFTISKANISASATGVTTTYDNTAKKITVTVSSPSSGTTTTYSTSQSGTYSPTHPECKNVGTYTIYWKVSKDSNYNDATGSATITINKKTLTVHATINGTAGDTTINEGAPVPTYGVSYSGFASGDDASKLTTQPTSTCSPEYTPSSPASSVFTVTPAGGASGNYDFSYVSHTFRVVSTSGGQWFRLVIKDVKDPTQQFVQLDELALYDASFNRVNADLVEGSSATGLNFGECAYSGSGTAVAGAPVGNLFDGDLDNNHKWAREGVTFTGGNYPTITMHLPDDAAPVTYYNFASGGDTANRSGCCAPVSWRLERSTDGANWELFHEQTDVEPVEENDTWLVEGGTENPPQYVIRGDGKRVEWMKPPRQFIRFTVLKTSNGGTGVKTVGPMYIGKIALYDAQGNYLIPTDDVGGEKIGRVNTLPELKAAIGKPTISDNSVGGGPQEFVRLQNGDTEWYISSTTKELADCHWYIVTTNESPLAAYDIRTFDGASKNKSWDVLAWRIETSATCEDDDWQFFDERDFTDTDTPFKDRVWYGSGGSNPTPAFRPSFLNQVASSPLRTTESDPLATGGDIVLKDGGDYIHVFTNASASATFTVSPGSILEVLAVGAGGAGSVGGGNAGALADASEFAVNQNSTYTIHVGAGGTGNGGNSTITKTSGVALSLTANGGTAGGSDDGKGGTGAKENGKPMSGNVGGAGGAGVLNAILGWNVTFAGGGGGAGRAGCGAGGRGGGGSRASSDYSSINGEPGLGGGGGGAVSGGTAGVGGSGLVVIRVKDATGLSSVTLNKYSETYGNADWNVLPTVLEVKDGSGAPLTEGTDYTKAWTKDGSPVSVIDNVGVYTLTVTAIPGSDRTSTLTATYTVNTRYIAFKSRSIVTLYTGEPQDFPDEECLADIADLAFLSTGYHRNTEIGVYDKNIVIGKFGPNYKINVSPNNGRVAWATGGDASTEWMTWEIKPETVVIKLDKNGGSTDPDPDEIDVETGVTLKTLGSGQIGLHRTGYTFDGYADKNGNRYYYSDGHSDIKYPATGGATKLYALWTALDYPVTLKKNDGTETSITVHAHYNEFMPQVVVPIRAGYIFEGYFTEQDGTGDQYYDNKGTSIKQYTNTSLKTLYAKWKADFVEVTLHGNGGSAPNPTTVTATPGAAMPTLVAGQIPTRTGYTFTGYFNAATGGTKYYNDDGSSAANYPTADGPADLYAQWTENSYTVTFNGNGSTSGSMSDQTYTYTESKALSENRFTRAYTVSFNSDGGSSCADQTANYTVPGWATSAGGTKVFDAGATVSGATLSTYATDGTVNLYAVWQSASITLPTPTKNGYTFAGWYNGSTKVTGTSYTPTANVTLTAHWTANTYHVLFEADGKNTDGRIPYRQDFVYDQTQKLTANMYVREVTVTYASEVTGATLGKTSETVAAQFNKWTYINGVVSVYDQSDFKVDNRNFSQIDSNGDIHFTAWWHDPSVTLPTASKAGYTFDGWYNAGGTRVGGAGDSYTVKDKTVTLTAHWTANTYKITFKANGGKNADFQEDVTYNGTLPNATAATPPDQATGVTFAGYYDIDDVKWYDDNGTPVSGKSPYTRTSDLTLYAHWNATKYYKVGQDTASSLSFEKSANPESNIGWALYDGGPAIVHTVSRDCYYFVSGGNLRTPEKTTSTFAGESLTVSKTFIIGLNANVSAEIVAEGTSGNATATWSTKNYCTLDGTISVNAGKRFNLYAYHTTSGDRDCVFTVASAIDGAGDLGVGMGALSDKTKSQLKLAGDMSKFTGNLVNPGVAENPANYGKYILTISGSFGGGIASLPHDDDSVGSEIIVNYDGLTGADEKGLPINSTGTGWTIPRRVKDSITFFGSSGFTTPNFPLMTFPAGTTVNLTDFTVYHAATADGDKEAFTNLGLRTNSDGSITLVANVNRGLVIVVH